MNTRTHTHFWSEDQLAILDKTITELTSDLEKRLPFVTSRVADKARERIKMLNAIWHLCSEEAT